MKPTYKQMANRYLKQKFIIGVLTDENKLLGKDLESHYRRQWERTGATAYTVTEDDIKLGTISVGTRKPEKKLMVIDEEAFKAWALANGYGTSILVMDDEEAIKEWALVNGKAHYETGLYPDALEEAERNGEVPDGCSVVEIPGGFKNIICRPDKKVLGPLFEAGKLDGMRALLGTPEAKK